MTGDDELFSRVPRFLRRAERSAPPSAHRVKSGGIPPEEPREVTAAAPTAAPSRIFMRNGRAVLPDTQAPPIESRKKPRRTKPTGDESDSPFQVTLPRDVIRQIRMRAAEEGTTHRAIILRSLRECGFTVAEGVDVDRRRASARRV